MSSDDSRSQRPPVHVAHSVEAWPESQRAPDHRPLDGLFSPTCWSKLHTTLKLSRKQVDVIQVILCGYCEKNGAERLAIPRRTLHARLERLYLQFGVHSRTELITRVLAVLLSP